MGGRGVGGLAHHVAVVGVMHTGGPAASHQALLGRGVGLVGAGVGESCVAVFALKWLLPVWIL